jgi:predicted DNA-binding transcriptional regulator AlpA
MSTPTSFPKSGLLRLRAIIAPDGPIPVARSTWWLGVKTGRFPKPLKLGPNTTVWRAADIAVLIERGANSRPRPTQSTTSSTKEADLG